MAGQTRASDKWSSSHLLPWDLSGGDLVFRQALSADVEGALTGADVANRAGVLQGAIGRPVRSRCPFVLARASDVCRIAARRCPQT